ALTLFPYSPLFRSSVVTVRRLVLDVRDVDRDTALLLLGRGIDLVEVLQLVRREVGVRLGERLRDRGRQRRLTVVDVTDGADVDVRLGPLELGLSHWGPPGTWVDVPNV